MNEEQFLKALDEFCAENKFVVKYKFHVGRNLAVVIFGKECVAPFDEWLSNNSAEHTTPTSCEDGIISYVTLK